MYGCMYVQYNTTMLSSYSAGRQKLVLQMAGRFYVVTTTPTAENSSISTLTLKKPLRSLVDPCKTEESFALSVPQTNNRKVLNAVGRPLSYG